MVESQLFLHYLPPFLLPNVALFSQDAKFQAEHLLSPPSLQYQIARDTFWPMRHGWKCCKGREQVVALLPPLEGQDTWNCSSHLANMRCQA